MVPDTSCGHTVFEYNQHDLISLDGLLFTTDETLAVDVPKHLKSQTGALHGKSLVK